MIHRTADPILGKRPDTRVGRQLWRMRHQVRKALGVTRSFTTDGVRFRELSPEPLGRALSRKGKGHKGFIVTFRDRARMKIRCTPNRAYADITGPVLLERYRTVEDSIHPGMRVLDFGCGTGYTADWLARRVGPSGAVVALEPDSESIRFASRRYDPPNIAWESGSADALAGETDGAFDAVLVVCSIRDDNDPALLAELWRLVTPNGWMLVSAPTPVGHRPREHSSLHRFTKQELIDLLRNTCRDHKPHDDEDHETKPAPPPTITVLDHRQAKHSAHIDVLVRKAR